jgi:hypothetical protein
VVLAMDFALSAPANRKGTNAWRLPDNRALPIKELEHLPSLLGSDDDQLA